MRIVVIVQARMGSTRLPGKVLADVQGHPVLWHVVTRALLAPGANAVIVATSDKQQDDPIADLCQAHDIPCFRGSEGDVLDRYYGAAREHQADVVVRVTGDCPLLDPEVLDRVVQTYLQGGFDYVSNTLRPTYPDGLDAEVFSFAALEEAWRDASLPAEREHVTPYIRASGRFRTRNVTSDVWPPTAHLRWTVDGPADLEFVRQVYARLGQGDRSFGWREVVRLSEEFPDLMQINAGSVRNEGYYRSLLEEDPLAPSQLVLDGSREYLERARKVIPSCTQTFSKGPDQFVQGVSPIFLSRGQGSHVWDVDDNEFIDYVGALGPVVLGYDYPAVTRAAEEQLRRGVSFSLPHQLEVELAEKLVSLIPCAEMVRYGKSGSDATSAAVRVARAFTGRDIIACCGYHGWQDWFIGTTTRNRGVPDAVARLTVPFGYNDLESLQRVFEDHPGQVAAVIIEPIGVIEPVNDFLQKVLETAHREGTLVIFDEVVTGFRIHLGGAQAHYGVTPDMACFGKAMANGFPLSAVVGRRDIMELFDEVFFSSTFGGESVSLAAALATICEMEERGVVAHLWEQGGRLQDGYNVLARELGLGDVTRCVGLPPHTVMEFADIDGAGGLVLRSLLQQELVRRGVLFLVGLNPSYAHDEGDVEHTLRAFRAALDTLARAVESQDPRSLLLGEPVQPVFRQP
jgi:glutamate-1-semialdehyde aminotransferase/spore coat polysaccharide biosynthesis protein SpsF (cytidylyltransferase family)